MRVRDEVPESECTAIFCVADILTIVSGKSRQREYGRDRCSPSYVEVVARLKEDTFPKGRRGGDKGPPAARGSARWELSSSNEQPHVYYHPTPPFARILSTPDEMAEPIVQTIHRDPALLYVQCASRRRAIVLTR
jgi:hypothetical protein